jgi:[1-hydroxy-2-(trimethylamino)ethyl]phosphonate dioxygenase
MQVNMDEIVRLFAERGDSEYGGEAVTQLQHALQAATFAQQQAATSAEITAALLHDVGHLLHRLPDDAPDQGIDDHHEMLAARWLEKRFGADVVDPVRLHVSAKRFLCTTVAGYYEALSAPSRKSLRLQGGKMSPDELAAFRKEPHFESAVRLRRWDDAAKIVGMVTPALSHFLPHVRISMLPSA